MHSLGVKSDVHVLNNSSACIDPARESTRIDS